MRAVAQRLRCLNETKKGKQDNSTCTLYVCVTRDFFLSFLVLEFLRFSFRLTTVPMRVIGRNSVRRSRDMLFTSVYRIM